ncbi:MAG TPA: glycoside hydrolase family 15 protein [Streptosporangiaceae bacterium]|nr:glycoside hydrolase family 15 protein [Streptosporangiaceae bacterium]
MFGVGGERDLSERVLPHLAGWRGSAPVRVGNGAWTQRQVDVYGELLAAVERLRDQIGELDPATRAFLVAVADTAARRWTEKDQGIDKAGAFTQYFGSDGLQGKEGTFVLCTFWLAQALALSDQPERARQVFERAIVYLNDVGLLAEEVDPDTGELLGNFPQAFSHIGLVNAAWAISGAECRQTAALAG